jgi:hypothetical protein
MAEPSRTCTRSIYEAENREAAESAFRFIAEYDKAAACLTKGGPSRPAALAMADKLTGSAEHSWGQRDGAARPGDPGCSLPQR